MILYLIFQAIQTDGIDENLISSFWLQSEGDKKVKRIAQEMNKYEIFDHV